jgi:ATP-dependent RNA helicase RhlE
VLIATDIAARGIDVDDVTHVIQFDLPEVPETYVHRIGRTARAGASGEAVALCSHEDRDKLRAIEKLIRQSIPSEQRPGATAEELAARPPEAPRPPRQPQRKPQQRQAQHRPAGHGAPAKPQGGKPASAGNQPRRRPAASSADHAGRDRSWREGDFRDGSSAPAFLRGSR